MPPNYRLEFAFLTRSSNVVSAERWKGSQTQKLCWRMAPSSVKSVSDVSKRDTFQSAYKFDCLRAETGQPGRRVTGRRPEIDPRRPRQSLFNRMEVVEGELMASLKTHLFSIHVHDYDLLPWERFDFSWKCCLQARYWFPSHFIPSPVAEIVFICHETLIDSIHCGDVRRLLIDRNIINQ